MNLQKKMIESKRKLYICNPNFRGVVPCQARHKLRIDILKSNKIVTRFKIKVR